MAKYKLNLNGKIFDKYILEEYGFNSLKISEILNDFDNRQEIVEEIFSTLTFLKRGDTVEVILFPIVPIALLQYSIIKEITGKYPKVWYYKNNKKLNEIEFLPVWEFNNYVKKEKKRS